MNAFHSGCIGDIIYSLPTLQALDIKTLYIGDRSWTKPIVNRIGLFSRLIEAQGIAVKKHEGEIIDVDLPIERDLVSIRFDARYVYLIQQLWRLMAPELSSLTSQREKQS